MSRYIDADELIFIGLDNPDDDHLFEFVPKEFIDNAPTADVVEVVRCRDCRYWQEYQEGHYPNELCPWDKNETTDEDDYCSFGERRTDDN